MNRALEPSGPAPAADAADPDLGRVTASGLGASGSLSQGSNHVSGRIGSFVAVAALVASLIGACTWYANLDPIEIQYEAAGEAIPRLEIPPEFVFSRVERISGTLFLYALADRVTLADYELCVSALASNARECFSREASSPGDTVLDVQPSFSNSSKDLYGAIRVPEGGAPQAFFALERPILKKVSTG